MIDPNVAIDKLASMANPDEIAKFLEGEGIKGDRKVGDSCPVALYLRRETGLHINVGYDKILNFTNFDVVDPYEIIRDTPQVIHDFVNQFDDGDYYTLNNWEKN